MEPVNTTPPTLIKMTDKVYEKLKFAALVLLPALSTLYFTLGALWGFPNVEQVIGTIAALDTFLGVLLRISTNSYNSQPDRFAGAIRVTEQESGTKLYSLELQGDPTDLDTMKTVTFKILTD